MDEPRGLSNEELREEDLPPENADLEAIWDFAMAGGFKMDLEPREQRQLLKRMSRSYLESGKFSGTLTELRFGLFFWVMSIRLSDQDPPLTRDEHVIKALHALVEAIRERIRDIKPA